MDQRRAMWIVDVARGLPVVGFAVAVPLDHASIALLTAPAFALTTLRTLFDSTATALPAAAAAVPFAADALTYLVAAAFFVLSVAALIPVLKPDVSVVEPDDDTTTVRVPS